MRGRRTWRGSALAGTAAAAVVATVGGTVESGGADDRRPLETGAHPFRLSVADVVVDGADMEVRVRFFWDDLQLAVMQSTSDANFRLRENEETDAAVTAYVAGALVMEVGGAVVRGVFEERGVEASPRLDETMWWYRLRYRLPEGAERLRIRNRLLFNVFEDQRNLVHLKTRSGKERAYYFTWDDDEVAVSVN